MVTFVFSDGGTKEFGSKKAARQSRKQDAKYYKFKLRKDDYIVAVHRKQHSSLLAIKFEFQNGDRTPWYGHEDQKMFLKEPLGWSAHGKSMFLDDTAATSDSDNGDKALASCVSCCLMV